MKYGRSSFVLAFAVATCPVHAVEIDDIPCKLASSPPLKANEFGGWLKHGEARMQSIVLASGTEFFVVYRPSPKAPWVQLKRDIEGMNVFLANELVSADDEQAFLRAGLVAFLSTTIGLQDARPIDHEQVMATKYGGGDKKDIPLVERYELKPTVVADDKLWHTEINFVGNDGSLARWRLAGTVHPLRLTSMQVERLEPAGTYDAGTLSR